MTTVLMKLDAVNEILSVVGLTSVTALGQTVHATRAEQVLDRVVRNLQNRGWYFQRESDVELPIAPTGWVHIPKDVVRAQLADRSKDVVVREGRLFNQTDGTYVWDSSPTNLIGNGFTLSAGAWTQSNVTITDNEGRVPYHANLGSIVHAQSADHILDTSGAAIGFISQEIQDVVDGQEYIVHGYFRNGPNEGSLGAQLVIDQSVDGATLSAAIDLTAEPPYFKAGTLETDQGVTRRGWDAQLLVIDTPIDAVDAGTTAVGGTAKRASWVYTRARWVYLASGGTPTIEIAPNRSAGADVNSDMFAWGIGVLPKEANVLADLVRCLDYFELPTAARDFSVRRAAREFQMQVLRSTTLDQRLRADEEIALAQLMREENDYAESNEVYSNRSALNVVHRRHHGRGQYPPAEYMGDSWTSGY